LHRLDRRFPSIALDSGMRTPVVGKRGTRQKGGNRWRCPEHNREGSK
jgi:hypothetical protein